MIYGENKMKKGNAVDSLMIVLGSPKKKKKKKKGKKLAGTFIGNPSDYDGEDEKA